MELLLNNLRIDGSEVAGVIYIYDAKEPVFTGAYITNCKIAVQKRQDMVAFRNTCFKGCLFICDEKIETEKSRCNSLKHGTNVLIDCSFMTSEEHLKTILEPSDSHEQSQEG